MVVIYYRRFGTTYRSHLVNKANLLHNLFLVYLFLVYLSIPTCFGRLCAHHQEKQLCLCDTWYLLFCMDEYLVCRVDSILHTRQSSTQNNKYQVSYKHSSSPDDGHIVASNMQRLINILRINCAPIWFYSQDYTGIHGQQNIKYRSHFWILDP